MPILFSDPIEVLENRLDDYMIDGFTPSAHWSEKVAVEVHRCQDWSQPLPEPKFKDKAQARLLRALRRSLDAKGIPYRPDGWDPDSPQVEQQGLLWKEALSASPRYPESA